MFILSNQTIKPLHLYFVDFVELSQLISSVSGVGWNKVNCNDLDGMADKMAYLKTHTTNTTWRIQIKKLYTAGNANIKYESLMIALINDCLGNDPASVRLKQCSHEFYPCIWTTKYWDKLLNCHASRCSIFWSGHFFIYSVQMNI